MNYYMNSLNNSYLAVHTDALCANVAAIEKTLSPGAEIIPVLKCDAYGLSLSLTAPALAALPGIRTFALAHVSEGLALRALGIEKDALILGNPLPHAVSDAVNAHLTLTAGRLGLLPALAAAAEAAQTEVSAEELNAAAEAAIAEAEGPVVFGAVENSDQSILGKIGGAVAPVFEPLGFGNWQSTVATVMGLVAKEEVVGVFGVLYGVTDEEGEDAAMGIVEDENMSNEEKSAALPPIAQSFDESSGGHGQLAAFAFLIFNLLCAPCFAAMGAIKREMNNGKWTAFAIGYQCLFAYAVALTVYQLGLLFAGAGFGVGTAAAILLVVILVLSLVSGYSLPLGVYYDTESVGGGRANALSAAERTACAVAFCETIRSAGYSAGVYSYASWFYNALNFANISKYNIWIAQYRDTLSFSYKHNIWQYTGSGSVKGIAKPVDMNIG